jgi:uncharacterized membrane protein
MRLGWLGLHLAGGSASLLLLFLFVTLLFVFFYYRRLPLRGRAGGKLSPFSSITGTLLTILRAFALFLLIILLFNPLLNLFFPKKETPLIPILIDISRSMSLPAQDGNFPNSSSRLEEVRSLLEEELLQELKMKGETPVWVFSKNLERWSGDSLVPLGNATDITSALLDLKKSVPREITALLLFSDGRHNLGEDPVRIARRGGFPIYPVEVGRLTSRRDVAIEGVRVNEVVYAGDRVPVEVLVQSLDLGGRKGEIILKEKAKVLDKKTFELTEEGVKQTLVLHFVPEIPGFHTYTVSIEPEEDEVILDNNSRTFACEVLKTKIQPLIIIGSPAWNFSFLKNALLKDEKFDPAFYVFLGDGLTLFQKRGVERKSPLPNQGPLSKEYDCIVLLDIGSVSPKRDLLPNSFVRLVREFVSKGGGLLFMGSSATSSEDLNQLLPVVLSSTPPGRSLLGKEFRVELTPEGKTHPLMILDDDLLQNEKIWEGLPPFPYRDRVLGAKSGGTILAVSPDAKTPQGKMPLVATQKFDQGKVIWIGIQDFWRWGFLSLGVEGEVRSRDLEFFENFIGDLFQWLIQREERGRLRIAAEKKIYPSGEPVHFDATLYNEHLEPLDGATVKVTLKTNEGTQKPASLHLFNTGEGRYRGSVKSLPPGEFQFSASAEWAGKVVDRKEGKFVVEDLSLEYFDLRIDHDLLRRIANESGGSFVTRDEFPQWVRELHLEAEIVQQKREVDLMNLPHLFLFILVFLSIEWALRRKHGMP